MHEAVVEASVLRLRPILMTTGAMVLGTVPLALAQGAGAESRQQIGWVLVGGLMLGTLLTLFVVPVAYSMIAAARLQGQRTGASHTGRPSRRPPRSSTAYAPDHFRYGNHRPGPGPGPSHRRNRLRRDRQPDGHGRRGAHENEGSTFPR